MLSLLAVVLYVAFADLGRHKGRIEAFVTKTIGRPFVIEGPFKLKLVPVIDLSAERVRLGNVPGGSQPQMVEIGKVAVQIGFWSLISGPPDVRLIRTARRDLAAGARARWQGQLDHGRAEERTPKSSRMTMPKTIPATVEVPVVIRSAQLNNVRLIYREAKKPDRVLQLDKLTITPGQEDLLALEGKGNLDVYPWR